MNLYHDSVFCPNCGGDMWGSEVNMSFYLFKCFHCRMVIDSRNSDFDKLIDNGLRFRYKKLTDEGAKWNEYVGRATTVKAKATCMYELTRVKASIAALKAQELRRVKELAQIALFSEEERLQYAIRTSPFGASLFEEEPSSSPDPTTP